MNRLLFLFTMALLVGITGCKNGQAPHSEEGAANHLINEMSPYLLQHAHNPVDWYPWGEAALAKAKAENKLLIISIGYSSCHWCHVMEKESFSDTSVSRLMNEHFVSIKVDREERPDIDNIYMTACQLASEEGCGWPLNAIALPDGKPVFAGTYYPKNEWMRLLDYFVKTYEQQPDKLKGFAEQLTSGIRQTEIAGLSGEKGKWDRNLLDSISRQFLSEMDLVRGGRKGAPKFPMPGVQQALLEQSVYSGNQDARQAVLTTLEAMADGGIYDQIGGGFARYSTDAQWKVPHFEKMLYDNAQLISLYASAYRITEDPRFEKVLRETISFANRELKSPEGGYYSSIDADSEGEEGTFYTWTMDELNAALPNEKERNAAIAWFDLSASGNWENGRNILYQSISPDALAENSGISGEEMKAELASIKNQLFTYRNTKIRPHTDDKVLCSWNALMLTALLDAYTTLGDREYFEQALALESFLHNTMIRPDSSLFRTYKDGHAGIDAFLEDYALLAAAYIRLFEVSFDETYLQRAEGLVRYAIEHFEDEDGLFHFTSRKSAQLIAEKKEINDNVIPGSNSVMAHNLHRLGTLLYLEDWIAKSDHMLDLVIPQIISGGYPSYFNNWIRLAYEKAHPFYEVAIVGPEAEKMNLELQRYFLPQALYLGGQNEGSLELLKDKLQEGETFIYVCRNKVCKLPVRSVEDALPLVKIQ